MIINHVERSLRNWWVCASMASVTRTAHMCFPESLPPTAAATAAKSRQLCPTLCDPIDGSPPGSHSWDSPGKNMERVAISFSSTWKWKVKLLSRVLLFVTPWTAATKLLRPWDFPGKSTGVGCHCPLHLCLTQKRAHSWILPTADLLNGLSYHQCNWNYDLRTPVSLHWHFEL